MLDQSLIAFGAPYVYEHKSPKYIWREKYKLDKRYTQSYMPESFLIAGPISYDTIASHRNTIRVDEKGICKGD